MYNLNNRAFAEDKLPIPYQSSFRININYKTTITENLQGKEYRYPGLSEPYLSGELGDLVLTKEELDAIIAFFELWKGSYISFRVFLPWFGKCTASLVKSKETPEYYTASQGRVYFNGNKGQLFKEFVVANNSEIFSLSHKTVTKPIFADFKLFDNGTEVTNYTLNTATGEVTYTPSGLVTWSGSFDVPFIFEKEELPRILLVGDITSQSYYATQFLDSSSYYRMDSLPIKEDLQTPLVTPSEKYNKMLISLNFDYYPGETTISQFESHKYETENKQVFREFRQLQKNRLEFSNDLILDQGKTPNSHSEADSFICLFFCARGKLQNLFQFRETPDERNLRFDTDSLEVEPVRKLEGSLTHFPYTLKFSNVNFIWFKNIFTYGTGLIDKEINPIANCILIEKNNNKIGFTSHDRNLLIDGTEYRAREAISPSAIEKKADLSVNNLEIESVISSSGISPEKIAEGFYNNAKVTIFVVDVTNLPATPEGGLVLQKGIVGEISTTQNSYNFEILSEPDSLLDKKASKKISPLCPYEFGDANCGVDLANHTYNSSIVSFSGKNIEIADSFSASFQYGKIEVTSGLNAGLTRYIIKVNSATNFQLLNPFPYIFNGGESVNIVAGCQKTPTACKNYNNYSRFGGFPADGNFMPGNDKIYNNLK